MNRKELLLSALCICIGACAVAAEQSSNPILRKSDPGFLYAADPAAEVFDGKVYLYCSRDQPDARNYSSMQDYMILESSDLKTWINHGVVLKPRTDVGFEYASGQMNAPDCAYKDGWYYWYFPYDKTHVGVAKSKSPTGPWESAVSAKITTIFDPTVFVDDDGQAYIYGSDNKVNIGEPGYHLFGAKLKDNMLELDGPWVRLSKEPVAEAVTIFKRNGIYYFMARVESFPKTGYWMADNPLPSPDNPDAPDAHIYNDQDSGYASYQGLITTDEGHNVSAPSHMSAIEFKGEWYYFYHRGDVNSGSTCRRSACFDKMNFNQDGTLQMIEYTLDPSVKPSAPRPRRKRNKRKK
jgi:beta-xylosidase